MRDLASALIEAGADIKRTDFARLNEATKVQVADNVLTEMFKFVTDKYNAIDFDEIECSAGDISKFKYNQLVVENAETLRNIYQASDDPGAKKYVDVIQSCFMIYDFLGKYRNEISTMYKMGNGVIQLMYTSLVASTIYGVSALVMNTIRFVTSDTDGDIEVMFDEVPGSIRQVHIKNMLAFSKDHDSFEKLIRTMAKDKSTQTLHESVTVSGVAVGIMTIAGIIYLIPKILILIREIIYSIYYSRVKTENALDIQIQLIRTNIESLDAGRGNKKIIARQKRIADKLEVLKNKLAVKFDTADYLSKTQQSKENKTLKVDRNSPLMQVDDTPSSGLMI